MFQEVIVSSMRWVSDLKKGGWNHGEWSLEKELKKNGKREQWDSRSRVASRWEKRGKVVVFRKPFEKENKLLRCLEGAKENMKNIEGGSGYEGVIF